MHRMQCQGLELCCSAACLLRGIRVVVLLLAASAASARHFLGMVHNVVLCSYKLKQSGAACLHTRGIGCASMSRMREVRSRVNQAKLAIEIMAG